MSEERRKWLNEAIESMQGADPVKLMLEDIKTILDEASDDIGKKELALESLQLHTEDIDLANDFHKIGGFHVLAMLLKSSHPGLRWRTADLIATLTQNNPYCQQEVLKSNLLPLLVKLLDDSSEDDQVRIKALYALSCLTRDSAEAQDEFVKQDGFSVLVRAIQSDVDKLQIKATFLISVLCLQQARFKDILYNMGMIEQLIGLLSMEHSSLNERLVEALFNVVSDNEMALNECRRPELNLQAVLVQRKRDIQGHEEFQDELNGIDRLLDLCFNQSSVTAQTADR
jgi:hsp70-interacting protein